MYNSLNKLKEMYNLIVILGPTASGKTMLAAMLAIELGSEILSADSRQVYRGLDIGTGKDINQYTIDGTLVPFHLIDIVDPDMEFNLFEYQQLFFQCVKDIWARRIIPIMVGGTGLYIESVVTGYRMHKVPEKMELRDELMNMDMESLVKRLVQSNPSVHNTTDLLDRNRLVRAIEIAEFNNNKKQNIEEQSILPCINPLIFGIRWKREVLRQRITSRLQKRLAEGMIDEVRELHIRGVDWDKFDYWGLEYRYISRYLQGMITYGRMYQELNAKIQQFAKRQETWFRRMEKKGLVIHWINGGDYSSLKKSFLRIIDEIPTKFS